MSALPVTAISAPCSGMMLQCTHVHSSPHGQSSPAVVSSGQPCACSHSQSTTITQPPTDFPSDPTGLTHTYASYHEEPIPELTKQGRNCWTLCLSVPIPSELDNPTLTSLVYAIKYGTTWDNGNSTVQADTVLTTTSCSAGILVDSTKPEIYRTESGFGPRMIDEKVALRLSSVPAIKCNGGGAQWSHYIDHHRLVPNVRITQQSNLYLNFHVYEYPTAHTIRSLAVEVSATWHEDAEARKKREAAAEAARLEKVEEERKAKEAEEAQRQAKAAADKQAREAQEAADKQAKEEAEKKAQEAVAKAAPAQADEAVQQRIQDMGKQLGVICPNGYGWHKTHDGYKCAGGGHFLSFKDLGMLEGQ